MAGLEMEPSHMSVIAIYPAELDPEVASINNVMHLQHKPEGISRDGEAVLERKGVEMVG